MRLSEVTRTSTRLGIRVETRGDDMAAHALLDAIKKRL